MEKVSENIEIVTVVLESERLGLICESAVMADIPAMVAIEDEFFGKEEACFKKEDFEKWFVHNPDMFYVIKNKDGEILAFTILAPISPKMAKSLEAGEYSDLLYFPTSEVLTDMQSNYFYVADICATKKYGERKTYLTSAILTAGVILLIHDLSRVAFEPDVEKNAYGSPVTPDGIKTCAGNGFVEVARDKKGKPVWKLNITEEKFKELWSRLEAFQIVPIPDIYEQIQEKGRQF